MLQNVDRKSFRCIVLFTLLILIPVAPLISSGNKLFLNTNLGLNVFVGTTPLSDYLGTYDINAGLNCFTSDKINLRTSLGYIFSGSIKQTGLRGEIGFGYPILSEYLLMLGDIFYRFKKNDFNTKIVYTGSHETIHNGEAKTGFFAFGTRFGTVDNDGFMLVSLYFLYGNMNAEATQSTKQLNDTTYTVTDYKKEDSGGGVLLTMELKAKVFHVSAEVGFITGALIADVRCGISLTL